MYDSFFICHYPEILLFNIKGNATGMNKYEFLIDFIFKNSYIHVYIYNFFISCINYFCIIYFVLFFISIYFSFFTTHAKEESTIDNDMFLNTITIESEKEIGSFDDIFFANIIFIFFFGWYFYINFYLYFSIYPELNFIFLLLPFFYLIIIIIPISLLFDFGINYLTYLKGVNSSFLLIVEFMFDFIAFSVFFTRLVVQGVRLILMLFTFAGFNELILYFNYSSFYIPNMSTCINALVNYNQVNYMYNLYILSVLPFKFIYFMYELLHTFFVITVQSLAFFAMVF